MPSFPSRNARHGRTHRWPSRRSPLSSPDGRRLAGVHLHLAALTKHGAAATVVGEARERTLRQRAQPPRRDGGRGRSSRRLASPAPAPVGVSPHSRAVGVSPRGSGAEMNRGGGSGVRGVRLGFDLVLVSGIPAVGSHPTVQIDAGMKMGPGGIMG
jgi:hypothetical protein